MFRLLDRYVDQDLSPDELGLVEDHLARCARCAREYRFEASLVDELRQKLRRIRVPPRLTARILTMLARKSSIL